MLVGIDGADPDFDTVEEAGGAKTHGHGDNLAHVIHGSHNHDGPADHAAHVVTQPAAHAFTQPAAHTAVPAHSHSHDHLTKRFPTATGGSAGHTADTSMSGVQVDTNELTDLDATATGDASVPHTGGAVDAHSGSAVDAHSAHGVTGLKSPLDHAAHGAHAATDHKPPYIVVHMWKRTA